MARRRRQRFEIRVEKLGIKDTKIILAPDLDSAKDFYRERGYTVLYGGKPIKVRPRPADGGWRLDENALAEAIEFLSITNPVKVRQIPHVSGVRGTHGLKLTGGEVLYRNGRIRDAETATGLSHSIIVKDWLDAQQASKTLWHELAHAAQACRVTAGMTPYDAWEAWHDAYRDGTAYKKKRWEVEANETAEQMHQVLPLARPKRPVNPA